MKGKYIFGMLLILLGLGFLLDQFNVISFGMIFSTYWPMILIIIGVTNLFNKDSSRFGNSLLIVVGLLFQINELSVLPFSVFGLILPVILILVGFNILFSRKKEQRYNPALNENTYLENREETDDTLGFKNITMDNSLDSFAFMSAVETNNRSQEFRGGRATAVMGSIEIDFRGAVPFKNNIELELTSIMGSIEILVPENWRVEVRGTPLLGAISNKSRYNTDANTPILNLKCFVLMGSIEIK